MALADLVEDGFPEKLDLKSFKDNLKMFENRLLTLKRVKALMGAGSHAHKDGDTAINEQGITQNHAYAILDVENF